MTRLDEVLPFQWGFVENGDAYEENGTLKQKGYIYVLLPDGRIGPVYHDVGSAPKDIGAGQAKQAKHAMSDCLKRCAVHLGVGRYIYEMSGVAENGIPEKPLKKALAAVGYIGDYEKHHWGAIGGVRDLDYEDEDVDDTPLANTPIPPSQVDIHDIPQPRPSVTVSEERINYKWIGTITDLVKATGLNPDEKPFKAWLYNKTNNNAVRIQDILECDREEIMRLLNEQVEKKKAKERTDVVLTPTQPEEVDFDEAYNAAVEKDGPAPHLVEPHNDRIIEDCAATPDDDQEGLLTAIGVLESIAVKNGSVTDPDVALPQWRHTLSLSGIPKNLADKLDKVPAKNLAKYRNWLVDYLKDEG